MPTLIIDAERRGWRLNLRELVDYRELLFILAWRDFRVRYAQTLLGVVWGVVQPVVTLLILIVIFGRGLKVDSGPLPYSVFALAGLAAWSYFSYLLSNAGTSIVGAAHMVQKIYFPRLILPLSKAIVGFVEFGITFVFLVALMIYYRIPVSPHVAWSPLFLLLTVAAGMAAGLWLSALTIRYRDFQHIVPFMVRIGLYVTPIAYPASVVPEQYRTAYYLLNPMAGVVEGFRWSTVGGPPPDFWAWVSFLVLFVLLVSGLFYFKRVERVMADIL